MHSCGHRQWGPLLEGLGLTIRAHQRWALDKDLLSCLEGALGEEAEPLAGRTRRDYVVDVFLARLAAPMFVRAFTPVRDLTLSTAMATDGVTEWQLVTLV